MKGLFFLYHYSKKGTASSIQNLRFIKGLRDINFGVDIVTKREGNQLESKNIYQIHSTSLRYLKSILIRILPDFANIPDLEIFWSNKVKRKIHKIVKINEYDFVHTTSSPQSAHFIGSYLKKKYGIPWVAQFYDPWVDNNFRVFKIPFFKFIDSKMEKNIALNADSIIHTNNIVYEKWCRRYGDEVKEKMSIIPLCTDELLDFKIKENKFKKNKFILLHAGGMYGNRSYNDIIDALIFIEKRDGIEALSNLEIRQIGYIPPREISKIKKLGFSDIFKFYGRKPYEFVIDEAKKADALLLVDNPVEENPFFPSKLCEYFSFKKKIVGIVLKRSESHRLLKESGHIYLEPNNIDKLVLVLKELLNNSKNKFDYNFHEKFKPKVVAGQYRKAIIKLILDK